jgi:hypothetical protein
MNGESVISFPYPLLYALNHFPLNLATFILADHTNNLLTNHEQTTPALNQLFILKIVREFEITRHLKIFPVLLLLVNLPKNGTATKPDDRRQQKPRSEPQ